MIGDLTRRVRRNHGLEHATVSELLDRGVSPPLAGYSTPGGFFVLGNVSTRTVTEAAENALMRLAQGEHELAVSRYCGTTLMTGAMLSGLAAALVLGGGPGRFRRIPSAATAILLATIASKPLGDMLQRKGIPHEVLNAKQHEREAEIVAQAGRLGSVTISTNMAGRGTDIQLGQRAPEQVGCHAIGKLVQQWRGTGGIVGPLVRSHHGTAQLWRPEMAIGGKSGGQAHRIEIGGGDG